MGKEACKLLEGCVVHIGEKHRCALVYKYF